jgi:phosphoribosyl-ATP pyrophosphohydrolase
MDSTDNRLNRLQTIIEDRLKNGDPASSYVASLATRGRHKIAQKLGEEAVETIIAALGNDPAALTSEAADLVFHLTVLMADAHLSWNDVLAELERREGQSGLAEKAARPKT